MKNKTPITVKNEFINTETHPFLIYGFFEEFIDATTHQVYGTRKVEAPDRRMGSDGMKTIQIEESLELSKGLNTYTLKASKEKPLKVITMIQAICGRLKDREHRTTNM